MHLKTEPLDGQVLQHLPKLFLRRARWVLRFRLDLVRRLIEYSRKAGNAARWNVIRSRNEFHQGGVACGASAEWNVVTRRRRIENAIHTSAQHPSWPAVRDGVARSQ